MIDVTKKHYRVMPRKVKNPIRGATVSVYNYDVVDVNYHEGTDVPFFSTTSLLDSFKERASKVKYMTLTNNESDGAKEYFRREFKYLKADLEALEKSLDNLAVKQEDFKP